MAGDLLTIMASPETATNPKVFLVGTHNGWAMDTENPVWQFTQLSDNTYVFECDNETKLPADAQLKISARG